MLTNPTPYHQLIVQSQRMINDAFWNMWAIADQNSPLHSLEVNVDNVGGLKGKLDAPVLSLKVTSSVPNLYFLVTFKSGELKLNTSDKTWTTNAWVFSFPVNIGTNVLKPGDPEYEAYKKTMQITEGDFSLAQLYIDASHASELDWSRSSFGGEDWSKETEAIQQSFKEFVKGWLKQMADGRKTVVGVALQTNDPRSVNSIAPTFPPTSLDRIMYPWIDPASPGNIVDNHDSNALCYLMMTGNTTPPNPPELHYSGTWVSAEYSKGMLCMNAQQFWTQWLLPLVQVVNRETEICPTKPYVDANWGGGFVVGPRFYIGWNEKHTSSSDSYFSFKEASTPVWIWSGDQIKSDAEASSDWGSWWNRVQVWQDAQSSSNIRFQQGGQKISFSGTSTFNFSVLQTGAASGPYKTEAKFNITTNWYLDFALGVVSDGGLQIARIGGGCTSVGKSESAGIDWTIEWKKWVEQISESINSVFKQNLGGLENALIEALAHQHKLFLPASGVFLMQDAKFNNRGDLLARLHYNGAPPPGEKTKMPPYLSQLPDRLPLRQVHHRSHRNVPIEGPLMRFPDRETPPEGGPPAKPTVDA
ncbi:hypothetical protein CPB86DRAFT_770749 [Serendipita vermifera]|nr:hypothetical protein CPB86DRAFT_770749 [Serendipita vermifera]